MKSFICLTVLFLSNLVHGAQPVYECKTNKHTVIILKESKEIYNYKAWNLPKSVNEKADVEITQNNAETTEGTGLCFTSYFKFKNDKVEYLIRNNVNCDSGHPPQNAKGQLTVKIDGQEKDQFWCF